MKHEVKEFNQYIATNCWSKAVPVGTLFYEAGARDWARLACTWHSRYLFGDKAPAQDEFHDGERFRRKTVDKLVAETEFDEAGDVLFFAWVHWKKTTVTVTKITLSDGPSPKAPIPPQEEGKQNLPQKGEPAKSSPSWRHWTALAASVLSAVAVAVKLFLPGWVILAIDIIVKILHALSGGN